MLSEIVSPYSDINGMPFVQYTNVENNVPSNRFYEVYSYFLN